MRAGAANRPTFATGASRATATRRSRCAPDGFTLLEVMMVLGLVVIIGSLSWPSLQRPLSNQRLSSGAKQVRVALARARLAAIESGEAQQVRFLPGKERYRVGAHEVLMPHDDSAAASDENGPRLTQGGHKPVRIVTAEGTTAAPERWEEFRLPDYVKFAAEEIRDETEMTAQPVAAPMQTASDQAVTDDLDGEAWSAPIVFAPDGSAEDATIRLLNDRGMQIVVHVRGLTGAASIGAIERQSEEEGMVAVDGPPAPVEQPVQP